MTLATRCPHCQTAFRVVRDQLRVSDGWVRCGQCSEVFDASAALLEWPEPPAAQWADEPSTLAAKPPEAEGSVLTEPSAPTPVQAEWQEPAVDDQDPYPSHGGTSSRSSDDTSLMFPASTAPSEPVASELPGFIKQAQRQRQSLGRRLLLGAACVLALVGLLGQWALHERNALAGRWPVALPWLNQACEALGCQVQAPRAALDDLSVEATTFSRVRGNAYRLSVAVRNRTDWPVAAPALELSLTDGQDQVIARKVLMPADWAGAIKALPAKEDVNGVVAFSTPLDRVAGYRVLVFYP